MRQRTRTTCTVGRRRILAAALLGLALAPAAGAAPVEVEECTAASPPQVLVCRGRIQAGELSHPFDLRVAANLSNPQPATAPVRLRDANVDVALQERFLLGGDGDFATGAAVHANGGYAASFLPGVSHSGLGWDCGYSEWTGSERFRHYARPCFNGIPAPAEAWCWDPHQRDYNECSQTAGNTEHICLGQVVRVGPPVRAGPVVVPLAYCVDTNFQDRLLAFRWPTVRTTDPAAHALALARAPPRVFEDAPGTHDGLLGFDLRPYQPSAGQAGCYGHASPGGFLGTQVVCVR